METIREIIIEFAKTSKKSKFYFDDMVKAVRKQIPDAQKKLIKKTASLLVTDEILAYFSTGSTTMYYLKEREKE